MPIGLANESSPPAAVTGVSQVYSYGGVAFVRLPDGTIVEMGSRLKKRALIEHVVAAGAAGGATVATTWTAMPLTAITHNRDSIALGISGVGSITITELGVYSIHFLSAMVGLSTHTPVNRFRNTTAGVTVCASAPQGSSAGGIEYLQLMAYGEFEVTTPTVYELQYYTQVAQAVNGLGVINVVGSAEPNVLRQVYLTKESN